MNKLFLTLLCLLLPLNVMAISPNPNPNPAITESTPESRFTINNNADGVTDGTVTDKNTGLMWMRCSLGQAWDAGTSACTDTAIQHRWKDALTLADEQTFAGYEDWRLPNIKELNSIVEVNRNTPAINITLFPNTQSAPYWSSSPQASSTFYVWNVHFWYGKDGSLENYHPNCYVRLVRGGQ